MNLARTLGGLFRKRRIDDLAALERFMDSRAAFMAQKCVVEYCRARAGFNWQKLFGEAAFKKALDHASWVAYGVTLADAAEMLDAVLREPVGDVETLHRFLNESATRITAQYRVPSGEGADFWEKVRAGVREALAHAALRAPLPAKDISRQRAQRVFDIVPIHDTLKAPDYDYIESNLRVNLTRACDDLLRMADIEGLAVQIRETAAH